MINHITLKVKDFEKSKRFFTVALKPLGYLLLSESMRHEDDGSMARQAGFGVKNVEGKRDFWIAERANEKLNPSFTCLAFTASSKKMVNYFYKAALEAGGKSNGAPSYLVEYHPGYYAAYIFDPDGNNIEAVFDDFSK
jgi:predicted lactoylglutathione lyase